MNFWWERDAPLWTVALAPFEWAYRAGAAVHRASVSPLHASVPVISVGNLTAGGAGKTPVALLVAQRLIARGRRPAVLSRGYGRRGRAPQRVSPDAPAIDVGDEPLLLARRGLTVFVGVRRARLARLAVEQGADVLVLDDGLQHHGLARDLDIVVADASNPFGNGHLIPRGPLREPAAALSRVQRGLLWLTRCDLPRDPRVSQLPAWPTVESEYAAAAPELRGKRVFLFAGIARPASFEGTVRRLGAEIAGARWFRDHHLYTQYDLRELRREADGALLLTTEKDLVRIEQREGIAAVPVEVRILRGEAAFDAALGAAL
jgi:tetraacyldisaccharide 4'-kinase